MTTHDDESRHDKEPLDAEEAPDTGFTGGGGPGSVLYDTDEEAVDEAGEEMLKAPDEDG